MRLKGLLIETGQEGRRISAAESLEIKRLRVDGMTYEAMPLCVAVSFRAARLRQSRKNLM